MLLSFSTSFAGLCIFHHYRDCDPIKAGVIRQGDQLLPLYIVDRMSSVPGLPGLAVAGIFSGSLSTVSSAINSLAAVTLEVRILSDMSQMTMIMFRTISAPATLSPTPDWGPWPSCWPWYSGRLVWLSPSWLTYLAPVSSRWSLVSDKYYVN